MLTPTEVKQLSILRPLRTVLDIAADWALIVASFALSIRHPHPLIYVVSALLIARTQLALGLIMHDGVHGRLFKNRTLNNWVGQFIASAPIFFSFYSYRDNHLKHHGDPLAPEDPDITLIGGYPISKASLARKLLRDAVGISYFKFIKYFLYSSHQRRQKLGQRHAAVHRDDRMSARLVIFSIALMNGLILMGLAWVGHPWMYFALWLFPSMTILQVLLRVRGITEHAGYKPGPNQMLNARTLAPRSWQTFFFAPHHVHYHIEHHQYVSLPHYNLPRAHSLLKERGSLPERNVFASYYQVLKSVLY